MNREQLKDRLKNEHFDLLIVGGGITGCGIALDATLRGLKVGLVEAQDFAAGTSSRSTKLIHGGLRYLKQFEFKLVADVGKERAIVYENGPHVTTPEWMLLPIYKHGTFGKLSTSIGLKLYDFLADVKREEHRVMLSREQTLKKEPLLNAENLMGGGYYVEYRTDDARLTIEVMKKAIECDATLVNYTKVTKFLYQNEKISGFSVLDQISGEEYEVTGTIVLNASGPWVDKVRALDEEVKGKRLFLTKGVHLVFSKEKFPLQQAIYFDVEDGRMIFAIPRGTKVYVGTTDTTYEDEFENPRMTEEDVCYLLHAINQMFPALDVKQEDIEAAWSGLRPLIHEDGKKPSEISRKDEIWQSKSGLISIAGGKLTGYRKMAEEVVDYVYKSLERQMVMSSTLYYPVSGGDVGGSAGFSRYKEKMIPLMQKVGLTEEEACTLVEWYGSNVEKILYSFQRYKEWSEENGLPLQIGIQLLYGLEEEMVMTPVDFFLRRTGGMLFNRSWVTSHKEVVINAMEKFLYWNKIQQEFYVQHFEEQLKYTVEPHK